MPFREEILYSVLFCNYLKIQELQEKELQLLKEEEDVSKVYKEMKAIEQLKNQFEAQNSYVQSVGENNLDLIKKIHKNLEAIRIIAKENSELTRITESLKVEREQSQDTISHMLMSVSSEPSAAQ